MVFDLFMLKFYINAIASQIKLSRNHYVMWRCRTLAARSKRCGDKRGRRGDDRAAVPPEIAPYKALVGKHLLTPCSFISYLNTRGSLKGLRRNSQPVESQQGDPREADCKRQALQYTGNLCQAIYLSKTHASNHEHKQERDACAS